MHPMIFTIKLCVHASFRPVAPFYFLAKAPFLVSLNMDMGVAI